MSRLVGSGSCTGACTSSVCDWAIGNDRVGFRSYSKTTDMAEGFIKVLSDGMRAWGLVSGSSWCVLVAVATGLGGYNGSSVLRRHRPTSPRCRLLPCVFLTLLCQASMPDFYRGEAEHADLFHRLKLSKEESKVLAVDLNKFISRSVADRIASVVSSRTSEGEATLGELRRVRRCVTSVELKRNRLILNSGLSAFTSPLSYPNKTGHHTGFTHFVLRAS